MKLEIIIPVGPGHEELYTEAVDSVRVACLYKGPFDEIKVKMIDDTRGEMGRSKARNEGVKAADGDWIFFLDADDLMHPYAFENFAISSGTLGRYGNMQDATWGEIMEYVNGCYLPRYQIPRIEKYEDLITMEPYYTLQMGHFVKTSIAKENPFNEDMDTGEDWDYYLRLWKNYNCVKHDKPYMINRRGKHSTGPRSATGREWSLTVGKMLEDARNNKSG